MRTTKRFITGLVALAFLAGPALAQPAPGWQGPPGGPGPGPMPPHEYYHHHDGDYGPPPGGWHHDRYYGPPPGGWHRGDRFYGPPPYVVHNYVYYHLAPPPPGYYWVQANGEFLMIAITSGIIASILMAPGR